MKAISVELRNNIIAQLTSQSFRTYRQIAATFNVSPATVSRIKSKYCHDTSNRKYGRPRKLTSQNIRYCIRELTQNRSKSAREVSKKLKVNFSVNVSDRTIRNALRKEGLKAQEKKKKPKLSAKNIKARLEFAKRHKDWTIQDWKRVIWSDETKINRFSSDGRSWSWIREGGSLQTHHVKETVKYGGGSIMIWGCMTWDGPGFLCKISGTMNGELYKTILMEELQETINWYDLDSSRVIFQQDNDSKHRSSIVQNWLSEQPFSVLEWPAQSPDLNPIENLWAILKRKLNQYDRPPNGMLQLWERVEEVWNAISKETCENLVKTMPKRIQSVIKRKGLWTDY